MSRRRRGLRLEKRAMGTGLKGRSSLGRRLQPCLAAFGIVVSGAGGALAAECFPHCDYVHNYGPYDFTYVRPGLYGYPVCNARGECLPNLVYSTSGRARRGNIEVRFLSRPRRRP
ncbi:MAG TPA: hypothetical protein VGP86_10025 [Xanthobacteraceae bacterium]|nr:hypothetical protein [Xanthobacteraceae bacterium]